jgi:hypothetical protein
MNLDEDSNLVDVFCCDIHILEICDQGGTINRRLGFLGGKLGKLTAFKKKVIVFVRLGFT